MHKLYHVELHFLSCTTSRSFFLFVLSLYAFPPKGALGYEEAPFPHL